MKTTFHIARVVLGLIFGVLGMNGFIFFLPSPASIPATAMAFSGAMVSSHFSYWVFGVQVFGGILLLANRYVLLALVLLAGVLTNVLAFHITMWPAALFPMPIVATVLWCIVAWSIRPYFAPLFVQKVEIK
jgi:putative oxidoreductase